MLYTVQIANIRRMPLGIIPIDITIKTLKPPGDIFAPSGELFGKYKQGKIDNDEYERIYFELMRERFIKNPGAIWYLISLAMEKDIALGCFCTPLTFCHRYFAADIMVKIEPQLVYKGEWEPQKSNVASEQPTLFQGELS